MHSPRFLEALTTMSNVKKDKNWGPKPGTNTGGTGGQNVLCGFTRREDGFTANYTYPCHNPIHNFAKAEIVWSCSGYRATPEAGQKFLDWLIHSSPWLKTGIVPDLDDNFMKSTGFCWENLDQTPANLLHNFLIASRMAAEWPNHINTWHKLCTETNLDPAFIFLFLTVFSVSPHSNPDQTPFDDKVVSIIATVDKYDWPLDMKRATEEYVKNFVAGSTPGVSKEMFYPTARTAPVNTLWGSLSDDPKKQYGQQVLERYKSELGISRERKVDSPFDMRKKDTVTDFCFDSKAITEIMKREYIRMFGSK